MKSDLPVSLPVQFFTESDEYFSEVFLALSQAGISAERLRTGDWQDTIQNRQTAIILLIDARESLAFQNSQCASIETRTDETSTIARITQFCDTERQRLSHCDIYVFTLCDDHRPLHAGTDLPRQYAPALLPYILNVTAERHQLLQELALKTEEACLAKHAKSQFLANINHELRTPISSIIGIVDNESDHPESQKDPECWQIIRKSAYDLLSTIDDILAFLEPEENRPVQKIFSLRERLTKCTVAHLTMARQKGIRFCRAEHPNVPDILVGDHMKFEAVVRHVLDHAIQGTEPGGVVALYAYLERIDNDRARVHFSVSDTGASLASKQSPLIFEAITSLEPALFQLGNEANWNLSIASRLLKALGGEMKIERSNGAGTTIHLSCEFQISQATKPRERSRILLVEDNETNQRVASRMLQKMGYDVLLANNGLEAVKLFESTPIDLILMDIQMPIMDGFQATESIRSIENGTEEKSKRLVRVPIIALTANTSAEDRQKGKEVGMCGHLTKPINMLVLKNALEEHLGEDQSQKAEKSPLKAN